MKRTILGVAVMAFAGLAGLTSCDKNGQTGVLQHPAGSAALRVAVTPDKEYSEVFDASLNKLSDTTYLIITKAERGSVFAVHTGPLPTADHAVCFASINNPGFRECVEEYYHTAGGVAIQNNEAGWWATPL
ncbi:hypothetical protein [Hymenobacter terricola]|uniref:hypothetical protein n=1 Tax=Hymenobacter terricola TaxID=2819236 RepID=UPI001B30AF98|nr:hypothetical protein [Hymenobacter terricola]